MSNLRAVEFLQEYKVSLLSYLEATGAINEIPKQQRLEIRRMFILLAGKKTVFG
jgi:hypothetical protein